MSFLTYKSLIKTFLTILVKKEKNEDKRRRNVTAGTTVLSRAHTLASKQIEYIIHTHTHFSHTHTHMLREKAKGKKIRKCLQFSLREMGSNILHFIEIHIGMY